MVHAKQFILGEFEVERKDAEILCVKSKNHSVYIPGNLTMAEYRKINSCLRKIPASNSLFHVRAVETLAPGMVNYMDEILSQESNSTKSYLFSKGVYLKVTKVTDSLVDCKWEKTVAVKATAITHTTHNEKKIQTV